MLGLDDLDRLLEQARQDIENDDSPKSEIVPPHLGTAQTGVTNPTLTSPYYKRLVGHSQVYVAAAIPAVSPGPDDRPSETPSPPSSPTPPPMSPTATSESRTFDQQPARFAVVSAAKRPTWTHEQQHRVQPVATPASAPSGSRIIALLRQRQMQFQQETAKLQSVIRVLKRKLKQKKQEHDKNQQEATNVANAQVAALEKQLRGKQEDVDVLRKTAKQQRSASDKHKADLGRVDGILTALREENLRLHSLALTNQYYKTRCQALDRVVSHQRQRHDELAAQCRELQTTTERLLEENTLLHSAPPAEETSGYAEPGERPVPSGEDPNTSGATVIMTVLGPNGAQDAAALDKPRLGLAQQQLVTAVASMLQSPNQAKGIAAATLADTRGDDAQRRHLRPSRRAPPPPPSE